MCYLRFYIKHNLTFAVTENYFFLCRSSFQARYTRGRHPGPRYRFNTDFGRPRQNAPLLDLPRPRFPAEPQKPLLPPPPFPPPFLSTSVTPQTEKGIPARASAAIKNRPGNGFFQMEMWLIII